MDEIKTIPADEIQRVIDTYYTNIRQVDWHGVEITIYHTLSMDDALNYTDTVVNHSFDEDGNYEPRMTEIAFRVGLISNYSNVELPSSADAIYALAYASDLYDVIYANINREQVEDIRSAAIANIEHRIDVDTERIQRDLEQFEDVIQTIGNIFSGVSEDDVMAALSAIADGNLGEDKIVSEYMKSMRDSKQQDS